MDTYNPKDNVNLDVQVQDAEFSNHFMVDGDTSVIAQDTPGNKYGVDFYEASKVDESKGKPILTKQLGGETVSALKTRIFAPGQDLINHGISMAEMTTMPDMRFALFS